MKTFEIENLPIYRKDKQILSLTSKIKKVNEKTAKMVIEISLREKELEMELSILQGRRAVLSRESRWIREGIYSNEKDIEDYQCEILCDILIDMEQKELDITKKLSCLHAQMYEKHIGQYAPEFEGD